jgi:hypothetical protein
MKNLHILPTDKPSRVFITKSEGLGFDNQILENTELNCQNQNTYITSDEEIKQDWFISFNDDESFMDIIKNYAVENFNDYADEDWVSECEKIILTTDQDLIKDGVQAIDDEFLKWWIKNPSCEYVVVYFNYKKFRWSGLNKSQCYEIIIPQEENNMNKETLEEAAEKYASKQSDNQMCTDNIEYSKSSQELWEESKVDFISGALSDAARDYWYEKFQNEK